jgi:hypothetical protein
MNILLTIFVLSVVLLALDLWTAPKPVQTPRAGLKDSGRAA